jgi:hypothetical protein
MISDVDEIPKPGAVRKFVQDGCGAGLAVCDQLFFYYSFQFMHASTWQGTIVGTYAKVSAQSTQHWRELRATLPRIEGGGWHASYFGDPGFIRNKIQNFSHQELNVARFVSEDHLRDVLRSGKDLFGRAQFQLRKVEPGEVELPKALTAFTI